MQSKSHLQIFWERLLRLNRVPQPERALGGTAPADGDKPTLPIPAAPKFRWNWEAVGGPHCYLFLSFEANCAADMRERAARLLQESFRLCSKNESQQRWMTPDSSQWSYLEIALTATQLDITIGWSAHSDVSIYFLEQLLNDGSLALEQWKVETGGEGYGQHYVEAGWGLEEFANYCAGQTRESTLEEIEEQLKLLLAAHDWSEKYVWPNDGKGKRPRFSFALRYSTNRRWAGLEYKSA